MEFFEPVTYGEIPRLPNGENFSIEMSAIFRDYWYIFVGSGMIYLPAVYFGQKFMEKRKPVEGIKWILFLWNFGLSILSLVMFVRCFWTGYVQHLLRDFHWSKAICMNRHFGLDFGTTWTFNWMGYTKVLELIDTFFLVIRKKHVMTLHWFHHFTVLLFVWGAHVFAQTNVYIVFTVMNTFVHVLMYMYFAFASIRIFFPFPHILTLLQIVQMVVGCAAVYNAYGCPEHRGMWWAGMLMYASYFFLFSKFFYDKYRGSSKVTKQKKK